MDEHDPATAASLDDLAACLKHVHLCADRPTYRTLEQQSTRENGFLPGTRLKKVRLTRTTVSDVLAGRKFPGKAFLLTFVDACGIDLEQGLPVGASLEPARRPVPAGLPDTRRSRAAPPGERRTPPTGHCSAARSQLRHASRPSGS